MNISEEENKHTLIAAQNHQCEMYNTILEGNWRFRLNILEKRERDAEMSFTTGISWKILEILEKGREREMSFTTVISWEQEELWFYLYKLLFRTPFNLLHIVKGQMP